MTTYTAVETWLDTIEAHDETIETDLLVALHLARRPWHVWSFSDITTWSLLSRDSNSAALRARVEDVGAALDNLIGLGFIEQQTWQWCDEPWSIDNCPTLLCGDALFTLALP